MKNRMNLGRGKLGLESMESRCAPASMVPLFPMADASSSYEQTEYVASEESQDLVGETWSDSGSGDAESTNVPDSVPGGDDNDTDPGNGGDPVGTGG